MLERLGAQPRPQQAQRQQAMQAWLNAKVLARGRISRAGADQLVLALAQRPLAVRPAPAPIGGMWSAFKASLRQSFDPPGLHNRRERRVAMGISIGFHVLLVTVLLLFAGHPPAPPAALQQAMQVQYIGIGTPEGGGAGQASAVPDADPSSAASAASAPASSAAPQSAAASSASEAIQAPTQAQDQANESVQASQPLRITQTPEPDSSFVLPPVTARVATPTAQPRMQMQEIRPQQRDITLQTPVQAPTVTLQTPRTPSLTPQIAAAEVTVQQRQITTGQTTPIPSVQMPTVAAPRSAAPSLSTPQQQVRGRDVGLSEAVIARQQAQAASAAGQTTAPASSSAGTPASSASGQRAGQAAGSGQQASRTPGGWPSTQRGDDWGDSTRAQAGVPSGSRDGDGLFGADGRPRLAPGTAAAGGGFPPGSDGWSKQQLDRHGTWMTRPPTGYTGTRFDQYWLPSGTLLQEWVRRGMRNMEIPVPGTSKRIRCTISVLQAGGACDVHDPNMVDQPAVGRPPPDIPYKPELQE